MKRIRLCVPQALGTAINSTKVMKAAQVVKGEDGGEVSRRRDSTQIKLNFISSAFEIATLYSKMKEIKKT